jgi:hypothetical protein
MESWSHVSHTSTSDSDDETTLHVSTTESLPTWNDKPEPSQVGVCTLECLKKGRHNDSFLHILYVFP